MKDILTPQEYDEVIRIKNMIPHQHTVQEMKKLKKKADDIIQTAKERYYMEKMVEKKGTEEAAASLLVEV